MTIYQIALLTKKLQAQVRKFRVITNEALQEIRPDILEEIVASLQIITTLGNNEIHRISKLLHQTNDPTEKDVR